MTDKRLIWLGDSREAITEHRVFYIPKFAEAVYVLHAFEKRSRRTPKEAIDLAGHRLCWLVNQRIRGKG